MLTTETIDGYNIRWLTAETRSTVMAALSNGDCDGIGFNPYNGWAGNIETLFCGQFAVRALCLPFGDRVAFQGQWLRQLMGMEMLWLSQFSGSAFIESDLLRVLRLSVKPSVVVGLLPNLRTLYLREPTRDLMASVCARSDKLTTLELIGGEITTIEGVEQLAILSRCELSNLRNLRTISQLSKCQCLEVLILESIRHLSDLPEILSSLKSLRVLRLIDCGNLSNFGFLDALRLEEFRCCRMRVENDHHPALAQIRTVFIEGQSGFRASRG